MNLPIIVYIILFILLVVILVVLADYNKLIRLQNRVKKASSGIEINLNKRFELIPNIVECVKGYSKYENETLTNITELRNRYNNGINLNQAGQLNNDLNHYLAVVENYPELKANVQFMDLQHKLAKIEDDLSYARIYYNNVVTSYNNAIETVPSNIVAGIFNFKKAELFQIDSDKKENIKVEL